MKLAWTVLVAAAALTAATAVAADGSEALVGSWRLAGLKLDGLMRPLPSDGSLDSTLTVTENKGILEFRFTMAGKPAAGFNVPARFDGSLLPMTDPNGKELARVEATRVGKSGLRIVSRSLNRGLVPDRVELAEDGKQLDCETQVPGPPGSPGKHKILQTFRRP